MSRALVVTLVWSATLLAVPDGHAQGDFPQLKIDWVDVSSAPRVRMGLSLLDSRLRPVPSKVVRRVTLLDAPPRMETTPLLSASFDRAWRSLEGEEVPWEGEDAPTLRLNAESERGLAAVVLVPGYGDPAYQRGSLGTRTWGAAGLLLKKLTVAHLMNVLWVSDEIWTWVRAQGRTRSLSPLSDSMRERCEDTRRRALITADEPQEEDSAPTFDEGEAHCGLTDQFSDLPPMLKETSAQGFYPHLFGLGASVCGVPAHPRRLSGAQGLLSEDGEPMEPELGPSAMELGLRMLIRDSKPGQDRALIVLGDGRDGYAQPQSECLRWAHRCCAQEAGSTADRTRCVEELLNKVTVAEQERFVVRAQRIISLAKAAGVRIFSVINPLASPAERERLEILAWRTGGTARVASDANDLVDRTSDLLDEINGSLVLDFEDQRAQPGAELRYRVRVGVEGATYRSAAFLAHVPLRATGPMRSLGDLEAAGRARLGDTGFWIVAGLLALLLLVIGLKVLKKLFSLALRRA